MPSSMDAKVIVSTYEELPPRRRRSIGHGGASKTSSSRAKTSSTPRQAAGGCNRRALLLAYARQLRRRRVALQQRGPPLLEWGRWKTDPAAVSSGGDVTTAGRRSWWRGPRVRSCVRLWIRTFRRRVRRIRENASCKNGD